MLSTYLCVLLCSAIVWICEFVNSHSQSITCSMKGVGFLARSFKPLVLFDHFTSSTVMVGAPKISEKHCLLPVSLSTWTDLAFICEFPEFHGQLGRWGESFLEHLDECLLTEEPSQPCLTVTMALTVAGVTMDTHVTHDHSGPRWSTFLPRLHHAPKLCINTEVNWKQIKAAITSVRVTLEPGIEKNHSQGCCST